MSTHEKLKLKCPFCNKKMIMSWDTQKCIHCKNNLDTNKIRLVISQYEDSLNNSSLIKIANTLQTTGQYMKKSGREMQKTGCNLMGCFLFIIIVIILMSLL